MSTVLEPRHVRPQQWLQAIDVARETCARLFAVGRSPADAIRACGMTRPRLSEDRLKLVDVRTTRRRRGGRPPSGDARKISETVRLDALPAHLAVGRERLVGERQRATVLKIVPYVAPDADPPVTSIGRTRST